MTEKVVKKYKIALKSKDDEKNKFILERFPAISNGATVATVVTVNNEVKVVSVGNLTMTGGKMSESDEKLIFKTISMFIHSNIQTDGIVGGLNQIDDHESLKSLFSVEIIN